MSNDSMWSDYRDEALAPNAYERRQEQLLKCLSPEQQRTVRRHCLTLWAKHGKFRAYPPKGSGAKGFLEFNPALVPKELMEGSDDTR